MNKMAIKPVGTYTVQKQEFLNSVINKIGRQEYANQVYKNPLARLKGDFIDCASDIEEIYVARTQDTGYDKDGEGVFDRVKPDVRTQYHTYEVDHGFKKTIHDKEMRKGFLNSGALSTMADNLLQSLHNGNVVSEYNDIIATLKALVGSATSSNTVVIDQVTDELSAKKLCKEIKKVIPKMEMWNTTYSTVENYATTDKLMLFIDSDVDVEIQVEYLAGLFNMTVAQLNNTTKIVIPNMIKELGCEALLMDERCVKIHPTFYNIDSIRNTRGKFTNYDLVTSFLLSYTTWHQFCIFQSANAKANLTEVLKAKKVIDKKVKELQDK